jgi:hypothetical protein
LVLPLAFAQPALGALSKELRVQHLMLGAGGRIQKVGRQGTGAIGAKSGMGAGHADANSGKLIAVINKKRARRGKPETGVSRNLNPGHPPVYNSSGCMPIKEIPNGNPSSPGVKSSVQSFLPAVSFGLARQRTEALLSGVAAFVLGIRGCGCSSSLLNEAKGAARLVRLRKVRMGGRHDIES